MITREKFKELYQYWINKGINIDVAKKEPFFPEKNGIPPEMWISDVTKDGWVRWKLLESTLTDSDIKALGTEYQISIPPQLSEYLLSSFHYINQINNGSRLTIIPCLPSDNPLHKIKKEWNAWIPLLQAGYIPVAEMEDRWGPICYNNNDETVVWFDHEEILMLEPESSDFVSKLANLKKPLNKNLEEFYTFTFMEVS